MDALDSVDRTDQALIVTCHVGKAAFGFETSRVQEVVRVTDVTPVHQAPDFVVGVMNLRSRIVTIVDLGVRLALGRRTLTSESRILIVDSEGEHIGLLADRVSDVLAVDPARLASPPENVRGVQGGLMRGVWRAADEIVAILDVDAVLDTGHRDALADAAAGR